jgi:uncharacterized protein YbaP (TraB family)
LKNKKIIIAVIILSSLLACTGAFAESSVWKVQKDNSVIYLGGTCHILREADYPLPPEFEKAYKAAGMVVFETDLDKLNDQATQQKFLAKAMYSDGSTLDKHLSPKAYSELSAYCESNGIPLKALGQFKPSMIMLTLTVLEFKKLGVTEKGVDFFFHKLAIQEGKTIGTLETVDEQIDYLLTLADGNEDEFIGHAIKDMMNVEQQFGTLIAAWRSGDAQKLEELLVNELKTKDPKVYKKLIADRNRNWLPLIDAYQKTPRTEFILVGVAHLVGPEGIIEALKKKGYKVEKL